jgi:hypothetical protein
MKPTLISRFWWPLSAVFVKTHNVSDWWTSASNQVYDQVGGRLRFLSVIVRNLMCKQAMSPPFTRREQKMQRSFLARFAFWAAVGVGFCGVARSASAITVYNRTAAVAYANANWNKVVSDGYFYINSYPATYFGAGHSVPAGGNDCAHFVSSVLGTPGGGLTIPNRAGTYGEPGAARLDALLVGNSVGNYGTTYKYGELVSSVNQLTPGDVIGYDWDGSGNGGMGGIDHTAFYIGNGQINCHSNSRLGANWTLGGADNYFFIHITLPDTIAPTTPINLAPAAGVLTTDLTPMLTANAFSSGAPGSTHAAAEWKILNSRGAPVYDTGTDTTNLTSLTVPEGMLIVGGGYTWQVRYQDNYGGWSSYSTPTSLKVIADIAGDYNHDGVVHASDYVVWRNDPASNGGADSYNAWEAHFGMTTGSGAALLSGEASTAVPEPATVLQIILLAGIVCAWRHRAA